MRPAFIFLTAFFLPALAAFAQDSGPTAGPPASRPRLPVVNLVSTVDHPLRYHPDGTDFVIVNGPEYFNRPLYGYNTAFRIDGGDQPEFSLYLPSHGGNLRFGFGTAAGVKWTSTAARIVTRYRAGSLLYEITDPLLGSATLNLTALALPGTQGLIVRAALSGAAPSPVQFLWAYGGADGKRGSRDGDIGAERVPVSEFFKFTPASARGNTFTVTGSSFVLKSRPATIAGFASPGTKISVADANAWSSLGNLLAGDNSTPALPTVVGQVALLPGQPAYVALQRIPQSTDANGELATYVEAGGQAPSTPAANSTDAAPTPADSNFNSKLETQNSKLSYSPAGLPALFDDAEAHRRAIAEKVVVDTPDPYINAAVPALCIAADGVWDSAAGAFMHGAVAWRSKLLGWRGPYLADALGWHDRATTHLSYWAGRQNTDPVPSVTPPPDPGPSSKLSRDEPALHSDGDISKSHYDMNLVYIDEVFRHIFWTGDLTFARRLWPVIQRHLAWEQRLFRRTYGPQNLPLYEAYAAIWASDGLYYDGGGATHTTAYNYYHNLLAARLAQALGEDPKPYQREAALILQAMQQELWLPNYGWFAENKDLLGLQLAHPNPALWTFYHTVDSHAATPFQAWQMSRYVDTQIAHIPLKGPGIPAGDWFTLPSSNWMPYTWSLNNVVMAEVAHTALAFWESNRPDTAFSIFKGCLLDSMYLGLSPANVGAMTDYDVVRGEAQRDFADAIGVTSRALIEGLFGVMPDALSGEVLVRPGFPQDWDHASIRHPDFSFSFERSGLSVTHASVSTVVKAATPRNAKVVEQHNVVSESFTETYTFDPKFPVPLALRLQIIAPRDQVANLTVNGLPGSWRTVEDAIGRPRIEISAPAAPHYAIVVTWSGAPPATATVNPVVAFGGEVKAQVAPAILLKIDDPQNTLNRLDASASNFTATAMGVLGNRTAFVQVQQGQLRWWLPVSFELRDSWRILPDTRQDPASLAFRLQNNTPVSVDSNVTIHAGPNHYPLHLVVPAFGESATITLPAKGLLPGSSLVSFDLGNNTPVEGLVTNWQIPAAPPGTVWSSVNLAPVFNDRVTQIFKHDYLSPRSPFASLSIPRQGIGTWDNTNLTADINDTGLRGVASQNGGSFVLPSGIPFLTPGIGTTPNIAFVSQWDNFPRSIDVPLSGHATHAYFLMAGSTNTLQTRLDNGEVVVTYADGSTARLALRNPTTWWPIEQDYYIDDFAFRRPEAIPPRVYLKSGEVVIRDLASFEGVSSKIQGGAATVLDLPLDPTKQLKSVTVRALANDVVIGLMSVTLASAP